jgi:tetratricopeptide (TPR) repeat protein/tRNA A-37 threonylcarbamoyl transferase component Bud32
MTCAHCRTEHDAESGTCSTCGAALLPKSTEEPEISESDISTRLLIAPSPTSPLESEVNLATGIIHRAAKPSSDFTPQQRWPSPSFDAEAQQVSALAQQAGSNGPSSLVPGGTLGNRYRIESILGEGGMGAVFKAHDLEVNRVVAIKVVRQELAHDPLIAQRFKQELVLARQVTHRNVVRIYDLGAVDGLRFISMEYIDGRDLSKILHERRKLDPQEAAKVMLQVCKGLEAAHAQGVIHRDLKPENIMIDGNGRAAVMDFGIALSAESKAPLEFTTVTTSAGLTQMGSSIGTPRYMSPEQAHNEKVDARSDIYALGIIFYEALTGRFPFEISDVKTMLRKRGTERIPQLTEIDPGLPKRLGEIVSKCLAGRPEDRYQSTSELITDLEVWLGIRSSVGTRRTSRWSILAFALASAALIASFFLRQSGGPTTAGTHAPVTVLITDFHNATGIAALDDVVEPILQVAIEGTSFISSFNRGQAHKLAAAIRPGEKVLNEPIGRLVAIREGIGVVVGGGIERHGSGLRLKANAINANGKVLLNESTDFSAQNDLPKAVDQIAWRIRRALGEAKHATESSAAETFTSGSLASAQKYAAAQQLQWEGKWPEAIAAYREATALDPNMSRAYAGLAVTLANQGKRQEAIHYYQLALSHIDRESEREKYRTRGGYYLLMRDFQKAAEQFQQLVKQYPVDSAGLANLALAQFYARNMNAALESGRKAVQIYPQNLLQRNNVGLYAMYAGDFDSAIKESEAIIKINPSFEKAYLCLGISQLQEGSVEKADQTYEQLSRLSDWGASEAALARGDLAIYQGRFADAIQKLRAGISFDVAHNNAGSAAVKEIALASAELSSGRRSLAIKNAAHAAAANDDASVLYGAANVYIGVKDFDGALSLAKNLGERFEAEPRALAALIQGEIQLRKGDLHEAVASFEQAQKVVDTWLGRYDLGLAYLRAKLYPDAQNEFDICLKRRGEVSAIFLDDEPTMRYLPAVYYYSGLAKAGLQSPGAAEDFNAFLNMKQQSEADPIVSDAKSRVPK